MDANGQVYVADTYNHRVQVFTWDGEYISQWGKKGSGPGEFNEPFGITVDADGYVYVADRINNRIQKFFANGEYISQWVGFYEPHGVTVDKNGTIYVTDGFNDQVKLFNSNGNLITQWGSGGYGVGQFYQTMGIAVDNNGYVYVSDALNRVQVFSPGLPSIDDYSGLVMNGTFEGTPSLSEWAYGGPLKVDRSNHAIQGSYALQLGQPVSQSEQGQGDAWAHTTFFVRPEWHQPTLSFRYNLFVNDILDYSDFFVAIQDGVGLNHLETVLRDGYQPCIPGTAPVAGTDLGWRTITHDLSAYKGQHIRLVFSNRNLWPNSWGIWSYVDDVRVLEADDLLPLAPEPPSIISPGNTAFTIGAEKMFTLVSQGYPTPTLTLQGSLPEGITFISGGRGTACLAGTPADGTEGTYSLTITASNGVDPAATQAFTLTVVETPAPSDHTIFLPLVLQ